MKSVQDIRHFSSGIVEPYIFISYSHDDAEIVRKLVQHLETEGFCVWVDYENIRGQHFSDDIKNGIRECAVFMQCLSKSYITKPYCEKEYKLADDENRNFVAIAIDDVRKTDNPNAFPFGGNIYGFGKGIQEGFEEYRKSILNNVFLVRLKQEKTGEKPVEYIFAGEQILTVLKEHCEHTYHHSGNYVLHEIHKELFADIVDSDEQEIYQSCENSELSLMNFLRKNRENRLVLLKGSGGTGKTISILQTCKKLLEDGICAVYIPLNKIRFKGIEDPIKNYIYKHIMGCDNSLFRVFENLANTDVPNNVFLFLDGANELAISDLNYLNDFIKVVNYSREWIGARMIISSRTELEYMDIKVLDMLPLKETRIIDFLEKLEVRIPTNPKVLSLINNPLMLGLYADSEKYYEMYKMKSGKFNIKLELDPDSATKIIYNFMQTQLFQMVSISNENSDFILYHVLIDYALPAVAYQMVKSDSLLTEREVRSILKKTLDEDDKHFQWYIDVILEDLWWEFGIDEEYFSRKDMKKIHEFAIKKYRFLYVNNSSDYEDDPAVEFLHQEFRDYFAGVYFANEIRMLGNSRRYLNDRFLEIIGLSDKVINEEILEYCGGILQEEKACPRLEEDGYVFPGKKGRRPSEYSATEIALHSLKNKDEDNNPGVSVIVANLMEILRISRNNMLFECDYSKLDLRKCKMNGCYFSEFYKENIYASNFDEAILDDSFFLNAGHSSNVVCVAEGKSGWIYSLDEDGLLLAWNYQTDDIIRIKKYQGHPKAMTYNSKMEHICIVLDKQIILIECNTYREIFSRYNETGSKCFRYVRFDDSGNVKYSYDLEPFRWFDLISNEEETNNLCYSVMTGCACDCLKTRKIIYTLYGKNICILDYDEIELNGSLDRKKTKQIGEDLQNNSNATRIHTVIVNEEQDRFIVALGNNVLEYELHSDIEKLIPLWTYTSRANIYDIKYLRSGGFAIAVGKRVIILDNRGVVVNILHEQSMSDIIMLVPRSNHKIIEDRNDEVSEYERYYLVSKEGAIKEMDGHLNVLRIRKILSPSRFVWVKDKKTNEIQMLFRPMRLFPNGYRFSFTTGKTIPSGWCYEMKTTHYNMYRREYVINQGNTAVVYDIRSKSEVFEYQNHTGIWIFGCSFRNIKGNMVREEAQFFLRKNGGIINGVPD